VSEIWFIAINNLRRIARQPIMLFTTLALPFVVITVVGFALSAGADRVSIGFVSHSDDALSRGLVSGIEGSTALSAVPYRDDGDLERAVRRGEVTAGLVIPAGFADSVLSGRDTALRFVTTPNQPGAATVRAVVTALVDRQLGPVEAGLFAARHTGRTDAAETDRARALAPKVPAPAVDVVSVADSTALRLGVDYTGPSNLTLFTILTSITSAASLIASRTAGVTRRMLALPVGRFKVLTGEFLGRFVIAAAQAAAILAFCALVFGVHWGDPAGVAVVTAALCAFGAALGMLVGFTARSTAQAIAIGPGAGVALGMLGGCMWPLRITGPVVTAIGHVTPNAWAMDGYIRLINTGGGTGTVLPQAAVVAAMGAGLLAIAGAVIWKRGVQ